MSQPKMTSQKPNPCSTALQNFSRLTYLPRKTPSMSKPPTLTFFMPRSSKRAKSSLGSIAPPLEGAVRLPRGPGFVQVSHVDRSLARDDAADDLARHAVVRSKRPELVQPTGYHLSISR